MFVTIALLSVVLVLIVAVVWLKLAGGPGTANLVWLFLSMEGRIGRRDYALGTACLSLVSGALKGVSLVAHLGGGPAAALLFVPAVALMAKRLHDLGCSVAIGFAPVAAMAGFLIITWERGGSLDFTNKHLPTSADIPALCLFAVGALFTMWLGLAPGARGANPFGERPR